MVNSSLSIPPVRTGTQRRWPWWALSVVWVVTMSVTLPMAVWVVRSTVDASKGAPSLISADRHLYPERFGELFRQLTDLRQAADAYRNE